MKFNKNEFGWKEKVNINTDELVTKNDIPHYNEILITEISGDDYRFFRNNSYFNMSALNIDETKSYIGKDINITDDTEYTFEFVYDKETDALIDEYSDVYIYNHKSYDGTDFTENENSAVLTFGITPMDATSEVEGYIRLYEIDKVVLNNGCLSSDLTIKNSLTVGKRIGNIGDFSVSEGYLTIASGDSSHAEGADTTASGDYSHAEGSSTTASGYASHAEGYYTKALGQYQHVQGKYNIEDTENKYAHIVGNGEYSTKSNAHTLDWQGNAWYKGKVSIDGTPTEDKDLTTKKYVDDKTEILPVKNNYIIFEDVVPSSTEVASDGLEYYIFDSLQNEDMIISAVKYNLNVTFNDGTNDRTMDLIIERSLKDGVFCEKDGFGVQVSYSETNHAIRMILVNANDYTQYSILKATLNCDSYSNLLQDYHIENINYDIFR